MGWGVVVVDVCVGENVVLTKRVDDVVLFVDDGD